MKQRYEVEKNGNKVSVWDTKYEIFICDCLAERHAKLITGVLNKHWNMMRQNNDDYMLGCNPQDKEIYKDK